MKKLIYLWLACLLLLLPGWAELNLEELLSNLAKQPNNIHTYEADITTTAEGSYIEGKKIQTGHVYFQNPDNLRTDINEPLPQATLNKGKRSYVIDHLGNSQEIVPEKGAFDDNLQDPQKIFKKFKFSEARIDGRLVKLIGQPLSNDIKNPFSSKYFSKIVIVADPEQMIVKEIRIYNSKGTLISEILTEYIPINNILFPEKTQTILYFGQQKVSITASYSNILLNHKLPEKIFQLDQIKQEMLRGKENA